MDHRKQARIVDGVTDLYMIIRTALGMPRGDDRVPRLDQATLTYLEELLAIEDRESAGRPTLHLVDSSP